MLQTRDQKLYTKLFVTNIPGDISKEYFVQLIEPYAKNGRIIEIKFFKRVVSESCYAFIHFESAEDGEKCMEDFNRRILNGHTMRVGPASKRNPMLSTTNLYIEGVPREWTDQELRKHFGEFGEISAARILVEKGSNASREVGFVHFVNHEDALQAMESWQDKKAYPSADRAFKIKFANKGRKKDDDNDSDRNNNSNNNNNGARGRCLNNSSNSNNNQLLSSQSQISSSQSYLHPVGPSPYPTTEMNTPRFDEPCRYFQRGNCKRGKNCFYRHGNVSVNNTSSSSVRNDNNLYNQHHYSHHQQIPPPPPPPPPPTHHDPYSTPYPHTQPTTMDMSAYYQHYYAQRPPSPNNVAYAAAAAAANPYYDYYQQAAYAAYQYPQYGYPVTTAAAVAANTAASSIPQPPPPQQQTQTLTQPQISSQPPTVTNTNDNTQSTETTTTSTTNNTVSNITSDNGTDEKTNSTKQVENIEMKNDGNTNNTQQQLIAPINNVNTNNEIYQQQQQQAAAAAWYASSVAAPNMTNTVPHSNINPAYGASRHGTTAATDSRWDPYRTPNAAWPGYYTQPQ